MNILIANDDGPEAHGLALLRRAARAAFPQARIVTLAPKRGQSGQGLAITPVAPEELEVEQIEPDFYVCNGRPADLIYLGLGLSQRYINHRQFDLVLTGVNHGQNVGMDVFHSGTVGMAMLASAFFGVAAIAFSQQVEYGSTGVRDETPFLFAAQYLPFFLGNITPQTDFCHSVNFPSRHPKGQRVCDVSMFSRFRPHLVPFNRREEEDVAQLEQGYITISLLRPKILGGNVDHDGTKQLTRSARHTLSNRHDMPVPRSEGSAALSGSGPIPPPMD